MFFPTSSSNSVEFLSYISSLHSCYVETVSFNFQEEHVGVELHLISQGNKEKNIHNSRFKFWL